MAVSSLYLWRAVLQETQANTPFQKLRRSLLFFLQLLIAFLLILALARPFVFGHGITGRALVLVIDTSASMKATDVVPSRLDSAKRAAKNFLRREMNSGDVAAVIEAGAKPESLAGFTTNLGNLDNAIDRAAGSDAPSDMAAAMSLATSLVSHRGGSEIDVFTDGVFDPDQDAKLAVLQYGDAQVKQTLVGNADSANDAITAMHARRNPITGNPEVFVAMQRFGSAPTSGTLSLLQNGTLIDARALNLSGGTQTETFDSDLLRQGGVITARLDGIRDDLASDNQATIVLPPQTNQRILLVSHGNLFLEKGLSVGSDITLSECSLAQFSTIGKSGKGYAMVVFDGALPAGPLPPGNYLIFHAASAQTPVAAKSGSVSNPAFVDADKTQPMMRFVDLNRLRVRTAMRLTVRPWGVVLADSTGGPWIVAGEKEGRRIVNVAFELNDSDWPLRVSFPIFLSNAVDWLTAGGLPGGAEQQTHAGEPLIINPPPGVASMTIAAPDGRSRVLAVPESGGQIVYNGTSQVGLYHASDARGHDFPCAVNLLDPAASAITPRRQATLSHQGAAPQLAEIPLSRRVRINLWPSIAAVVLVGLMIEWLVYHRRLS